MVKLNKKVGFFVMLILLLVILSIILVSKSNGSVVNDEEVLNEVTRLSFLAIERNLTETDLEKLTKITQKDNNVKSSMETMYWLIRNNEAEHASHALSFINLYVQTGRLEFCVPHEVEHLGLIVEHKDLERAKAQITLIKENIPKWLEKSEKAKLKFPAYYLNYEEVKSRLNNVIENFESNKINEEFLEDINYIGENGVC